MLISFCTNRQAAWFTCYNAQNHLVTMLMLRQSHLQNFYWLVWKQYYSMWLFSAIFRCTIGPLAMHLWTTNGVLGQQINFWKICLRAPRWIMQQHSLQRRTGGRHITTVFEFWSMIDVKESGHALNMNFSPKARRKEVKIYKGLVRDLD